jgi:hypothetical protein
MLESENLKIKEISKNKIFVGELNDKNKRNGLGIIFNTSGKIYEGNWIHDKKNGYGFEVFL